MGDPPFFVYETGGVTASTPKPSDQTLQWIRDSCGGEPVLEVEPLPNGVGHVNYAIKLASRDVVVRWSAYEGSRDLASRSIGWEATVLSLLENHPVPSPTLVAADPAGSQAGV